MEIWSKHPGSISLSRREIGQTKSKDVFNKTQDQLTAEAFSSPASADCILAHLMRLAGHLHVKGTQNSKENEPDPHALFLITDYTTRLKSENALEVDLFLACEHFIETEVDGFFPTFAKLRRRIFGND